MRTDHPPSGNHWHRYAGHWLKVASPLSPHADDIAIYARELDPQASTLLLGVTPQIAVLPLHGIAVDRNPAMIRAFAPAPDRWQVLQADWLDLPVAARSMTQVAGDGALSMLQFPEDCAHLLQDLRRMLQAGGKAVLRLFASSEAPETIADIQADLRAGRIGSFHALKWRLMMSQANAGNCFNVRVADVLDLFNQHFADRDALCQQTGWSATVYDTIDVYRDSALSFSFPPLSALLPLLEQVAASLRCHVGSYELAERCPVAVLEGWRP